MRSGNSSYFMVGTQQGRTRCSSEPGFQQATSMAQEAFLHLMYIYLLVYQVILHNHLALCCPKTSNLRRHSDTVTTINICWKSNCSKRWFLNIEYWQDDTSYRVWEYTLFLGSIQSHGEKHQCSMNWLKEQVLKETCENRISQVHKCLWLENIL